MQIREATAADRPAIRDVARRSLQVSYSMGPGTITSAIAEWYSEATLAEKLAAEDRLLLVAADDGQVVGFSETDVSGERQCTLLWLHVDPTHRGEGVGRQVFEATRERVAEIGGDRLQGRVLSDNEDGIEFYEDRGFEATGRAEIEIGGETYLETIYVESRTGGREAVEAGERTVYVDHDATESGSAGAFKIVYCGADEDRQYGYYCANCGTLVEAMDAMGRIECDDCGNARKATRWDAAYL